jgi:paraquat-inducible protein B
MKTKSKNFKIGLFVLASFGVVILFVVVLGVGSFFQKNLIFETYFDESIQGLDMGSIVKFRGVRVGTVKEITFVQDRYKLDPQKDTFYQGRYVLVKMAVKDLFKLKSKEENQKAVQTMADKGLRVKLTSQGLTGTSYLEIDYVDPESNEPLEISWTPEDIYVPSTKSTISKLGASVEDFLKKLDKADVEKLVVHMDNLLVTVDQSLKSAHIPEVTSNANLLLADLRNTNSDLQKIFSNPKMQNLPDRLNESLNLMAVSMQKLNTILSSSNKDIPAAVENLRSFSEDLKDISNNFKKYPSYSIWGEAPKASELGKK